MKLSSTRDRRVRSTGAARNATRGWALAAHMGLVFLALTGISCRGQGTFARTTVTFDRPPVQAPDTARLVTEYVEGGFIIHPDSPGSVFVRRGSGGKGWPDNGSAYVQVNSWPGLSVRAEDGQMFGTVAVDVAEGSVSFAEPWEMEFVGYLPGGGRVVARFLTDGIMDGTGPAEDFETFSFPEGFGVLERLDITTGPCSLDNLVVTLIPEPRTDCLFSLGMLVVSYAALRRHARPRQASGQAQGCPRRLT